MSGAHVYGFMSVLMAGLIGATATAEGYAIGTSVIAGVIGGPLFVAFCIGFAELMFQLGEL